MRGAPLRPMDTPINLGVGITAREDSRHPKKFGLIDRAVAAFGRQAAGVQVAQFRLHSTPNQVPEMSLLPLVKGKCLHCNLGGEGMISSTHKLPASSSHSITVGHRKAVRDSLSSVVQGRDDHAKPTTQV